MVKKAEELDYNKEIAQYIILDKKYGLGVGLKSLSAVTTRFGLTKRNLIGVTTSNDVSLLFDSDNLHRPYTGFC